MEKVNERPAWRRWLATRTGKVTAGVVILLLIAGGAIAAILASADIEGSTGTGQVALDWRLDSGGDGVLNGLFAAYDVDGITINNTAAVPSGHTCAATITGGVLTLNVAGLFPGEGCV